MSALNVPIRIKRGDGIPTQLRQGELAFNQQSAKLYIGSGTEVGGYAPNVVELTTPPVVLEDLSNISVGSGASDGDVLVYDSSTAEWVAKALSIAWDSVTSKPTFATVATTGDYDDLTNKPSSLTPTAHKASHATGGTDALSPSDIGALASSLKGANNGVAELDGSGKLPTSQLPNLAVSDFLGEVANEAAMLALTGQKGDWASRTDSGAVWIITGDTPSSIGSWTQLSYPAAPVASVNGETGTVVLDHTDVGAAASSHTHSDATTSVAGFLSASDKTKLDGIASGATANAGTVTSVTAGDGLSGGTVDTSGTIAVDLATDPGLEFSSGKLRAKVGAGLKRDSNGIGISLAAVNPGLVANQDGFAVDFGTSAAEVAAGNHGHGNITTAGAIGSTSGLPVKTGASGVLEAGAFGTASGEFAEGNHTHAWADITSKPSTFTPAAHNHTVTLEMCGLIESPEAKTYVISPAIPAAITITNVKAKTSEGTVDIKLQDDGVDITNTTIGDVGTSVAAPGTAPSASVAADSVLALVVSDLQTSPKNLAFTIHYTVASQNNA